MPAERTAWCPCTCHRPHNHDQTGHAVSTGHATTARVLMDETDQWEPGSEIEAAYLNEAHVHATLAVAAELRVNNLLAIRRDLPIANGLRAAITTHLLGYAEGATERSERTHE